MSSLNKLTFTELGQVYNSLNLLVIKHMFCYSSIKIYKLKIKDGLTYYERSSRQGTNGNDTKAY